MEENIQTKKQYKCASCGASILDAEKQCSYCGTANPNFKKKEVKEFKPDFNLETPDDNIGGFLGGVILGGLLGGLNKFNRRRRR